MSPIQNLLFIAEQPAAPEAGGGIPSMLMLGLVMVGMWFLLIAPQRKKQKEHAKMVEALKKGDKVMTNAGIYGTITGIKNERCTIQIAENTKIEVNKAFVQQKS